MTISYVYHMPCPCIAVLQYKPSMQFIEDEIISDANNEFCNIAFFSVGLDQELRVDALIENKGTVQMSDLYAKCIGSSSSDSPSKDAR